MFAWTRKASLGIGLLGGVCLMAALTAATEVRTRSAASPTPADGHTIHVLAPHVINGQVMGPFHHYCKVISPEPIIECLIYESTDSMAPMTEVEYIVAKSLTRTNLISLADWNKNWHDHAQEIATGRVQVLDMPDDQAKAVADIVSKTDGIIFHLWPHGSRLPTGQVVIGQRWGM
jgi:hypothetical protein